MTRFVGLGDVFVNPKLVTTVASVDGVTYVEFGPDAVRTDLSVGEVLGLLEDALDEYGYRTTL